MSGGRPVPGHMEDEPPHAEHHVSGWFTSRLHHHEPAAPAAADPKENDMTGNDLRDLAGKVDAIGTEGLAHAQDILGRPETAEGFRLLHELTVLNIDPAIVSEALGALRALSRAYAPAKAQQAAAGQPA